MFYIQAGTDNSYDAKRERVFVLESAVLNSTFNITIQHTHIHTNKYALLPKYDKCLSAWTHMLPCHLLPFPSAMGHAVLPSLRGSRHFEPKAAAFPRANSTGFEKSFITENHSVSSKILSSRSCLLFRAEACSYLHILKRLATHIPSELVKADGGLSAGRGTRTRVVYSHPDICVQCISPAALSSGWATWLLLLLQELGFYFYWLKLYKFALQGPEVQVQYHMQRHWKTAAPSIHRENGLCK